MKYLLILFSSVLLSHCNDNCPIDKRFKEKFDAEINVLAILKSQGITQKNTLEKIKISNETLLQLTGHKANLSFDYTVTYSASNFESDFKVWNKWYENNKCNVKEADFDKIKNKVNLEIK